MTKKEKELILENELNADEIVSEWGFERELDKDCIKEYNESINN